MQTQNYSLRRRLLISATLLLLVFLGLLGIGLNNTFKQSILTNAQDSLRNQILLIVSSIDVVDGKLEVPDVLPEPKLSQLESTLFAEILTPEAQVIWKSKSLLENNLPDLPNDFRSSLGDFQFFPKVTWDDGSELYSTLLNIEWETDKGDMPFIVHVAEDSSAYKKQLANYQRQIGIWLGILALSLLTLLLLLLSWALKPLGKVSNQVNEIEQGQRKRFDEDYPREVSRLTQNLNQLLSFEEKRINRHKEVLGNLAHSLKTPLAVLNGLKYSNETKQEAQQQLQSMQTIIDYQLQSASAVGRRRFSKPINIIEPTNQIISSLKKLHKDKNLQVSVHIPDDIRFYGDEGDWMELAGNLLDNAFKWANTMVSISVSNQPILSLQTHRKKTMLIVEDDGNGIDDELRNTILQRGVRLDSQTPGHGLGLHIVKGIVEAYDGDIDIQNNQPQGTRFEVGLS